MDNVDQVVGSLGVAAGSPGVVVVVAHVQSRPILFLLDATAPKIQQQGSPPPSTPRPMFSLPLAHNFALLQQAPRVSRCIEARTIPPRILQIVGLRTVE